MNLGELRTGLQALGYNTETVSQQNYFLNATYREVIGADRWPFLEKQATLTLTPNQFAQSYSTITDLLEWDAVRLSLNGDTWNLENTEPQAMRDLETDYNTSVGTPEKWSLLAGQVHFWPAPDQPFVATVDYIYAPPDLVSDSDVPVIPAQFHDVLVLGAAETMAYRERDIWSQYLLDSKYQAVLLKMRESFLLRQRQTSSRVKKSGYWNARRPSYWTSW